LVQDHGQRPGIIEYLHLLKLAADHTVPAVEKALGPRLASEKKWWAADVRAALTPTPISVPTVAALSPDLRSYDALLSPSAGEEVAHVS
jgi:hypothetical protein